MSKNARTLPPIALEERATRQRELSAAIKAAIQSGRDGRPLSEEENQELDKDLAELKRRYWQWRKIEQGLDEKGRVRKELLPTTTQVAARLKQLETATNDIQTVLLKMDAYTSSLLIDSIDEDCKFLENPIWHQKDTEESKSQFSISPITELEEIEYDVSHWAISFDDNRNRISRELAHKALLQNFNIWLDGIRVAKQRLEFLNRFVTGNIFKQINGGSNGQLVHACHSILKKYTNIDPSNQHVIHSELVSVVLPLIAEKYDLEDDHFKRWADGSVKEYWAYRSAIRDAIRKYLDARDEAFKISDEYGEGDCDFPSYIQSAEIYAKEINPLRFRAYRKIKSHLAHSLNEAKGKVRTSLKKSTKNTKAEKRIVQNPIAFRDVGDQDQVAGREVVASLGFLDFNWGPEPDED